MEIVVKIIFGQNSIHRHALVFRTRPSLRASQFSSNNTKFHVYYAMSTYWKARQLFIFFQLLQFLMHLRGEPIGLSVGGLVMIDKSLTLSVCSKRRYFALFIFSLSLLPFLSLLFFFLPLFFTFRDFLNIFLRT